MSGPPPDPELQGALLELQQYLSDAVPPLVVADSIELLMKYPPQAVLPTIRAWTGAQYRGGAGAGVPVSDYLFHALKKIHMMGEFKLVAGADERPLGQLKPVVLPAEDRDPVRRTWRLGSRRRDLAGPEIHRRRRAAAAFRRPGWRRPTEA
jgi:hypothetical protein